MNSAAAVAFETFDITVMSPDGKPLTVVITGEADQSGFILDLLENAGEYMEWIRAGGMGTLRNGFTH